MQTRQFIWLGTAPQLAKMNNRTITLADAVVEVSDAVTCLGVVIDSQLSFANHVKKLAGSCFYQLRQLRTVRCSLTTDALISEFPAACTTATARPLRDL